MRTEFKSKDNQTRELHGIEVGIAEVKVAKAPSYLYTLGIGSCVIIAMYDPALNIGGMAHCLLPGAFQSEQNGLPAKYVDRGIPFFMRALLKEGARRPCLVAKIVGGAKLFKGNNPFLDIGLRNVAMARASLKEMGVKLLGEDVGGDFGRTVLFFPQNWELRVRTYKKGDYEV
jgi:chemotaxis protein CheD